MPEVVQTTVFRVIEELTCEICCIDDGNMIIARKVMNALRGTLSELHQSQKCRSERSVRSIWYILVP